MMENNKTPLLARLDPEHWNGPISEDFFNAPYDEAGLVQVQGSEIPWSITTPDYCDQERAYTVSPFAHYVGYAYDEIGVYLTGVKRWIVFKLIWCLGLILRMLRVDDCLFFNNLLLSTNLWPNTIKWSVQQVQEINNTLRKISGEKAIVWQSVDPLSQPLLTQVMYDLPCILVPSRIVNWMEFSDKSIAQKKHNLRRDCSLFKRLVGWDVLEQKHVVKEGQDFPYVQRFVGPEAMTIDIARQVTSLYNQLYLGKYSRHNPEFTPEGVVRLVHCGFMSLSTLCLNTDPSKIVAFAASNQKDGVLCFPMIGYDMSSKDKYLYRFCCVLELNESIRTGLCKAHWSGGANEFKRHRGATTTVEYNAVFVDHLPFYRRWCWQFMKFLFDKIITVQHAH